ncbi:MAG: DNA-deoxyinosine glycosylase, partial [Gammaproteobacteria bacterium]|nr:DNA-deoxyinosine glycosylase [Gammaproteobacteria bacterium]
MARVHSFEPIVGRDPRILILGSMPGVMSLQAVEYYANPRNVFWKIIGELFELDTECSY